MSTVDLFNTPAPPPIPRDRWKRPLVVPAEGGKPKPYTRCTRFIDCLEDKYNLQQWEKRMVAIGLVDRPDLQLAIAAHRDSKGELDRHVAAAKEAAAASGPATIGTAEHALCEQIDKGLPLGKVPAAYVADLEAYVKATAALRPVEIEQFTVLDELMIGGTPDRVVEYRGHYRVADIKTGSIDYGGLKIAMQMAVYSRSTPYDHVTCSRPPRSYTIDTERAIIIHLPAGEGRCDLYEVDITAGWEAVRCAAEVREWRARKNWFIPLPPAPQGDNLTSLITAASTVDELRQLWTSAIAAGTWTDDALQLALARKKELEGA